MKRLFFLLITIASINATYAQTLSATDVKKMADDKKFKFAATDATTPTDVSGTNSSITSDKTEDNHKTLKVGVYNARVTPDSAASYLPYYDKSNTVAAEGENSTTTVLEDATKVGTTVSNYQVKQKKNGEVIINITPTNGRITKYVFYLELNGTAKLEATIDDYKVMKYSGTFAGL